MAKVTSDTVNSAIEVDSVFVIGHTDESGETTVGRVDEIYSPAVTLYVNRDGDGVGEETIDGVTWNESKTWKAVTGYSSQYGYSGPTMHSSEFLGGGMARDVLADAGGVYVLVIVECLPDWEVDEDNEDDVFEEMSIRDNPAGWMLLKMVGKDS